MLEKMVIRSRPATPRFIKFDSEQLANLGGQLSVNLFYGQVMFGLNGANKPEGFSSYNQT